MLTDLVFTILPSMLGRKKKTGVQRAREFTENMTIKMGSHIGKVGLPIQAICKICIVLFSFSIAFGIYGLASRMNDISKKEQHIEKLRDKLQSMENQLEKKIVLKEKLMNDSLAMEALARSYGMSKKGEKVFYFLD
jgi:cell division protein FtsB